MPARDEFENNRIEKTIAGSGLSYNTLVVAVSVALLVVGKNGKKQ